MQETVFKGRPPHLDPVGEDEAPLELSRGNAAMEEHAALPVITLLPADHELVVFQRDREIVLGKARNRERNPIETIPPLLDVVGRITFPADLAVRSTRRSSCSNPSR